MNSTRPAPHADFGRDFDDVLAAAGPIPALDNDRLYAVVALLAPWDRRDQLQVARMVGEVAAAPDAAAAGLIVSAHLPQLSGSSCSQIAHAIRTLCPLALAGTPGQDPERSVLMALREGGPSLAAASPVAVIDAPAACGHTETVCTDCAETWALDWAIYYDATPGGRQLRAALLQANPSGRF